MVARADYTGRNPLSITEEKVCCISGVTPKQSLSAVQHRLRSRERHLLGDGHPQFTQNLLSSTRAGFSRDTTENLYNQALGNTPTLFLYNGATLLGQQLTMPGFYSDAAPSLRLSTTVPTVSTSNEKRQEIKIANDGTYYDCGKHNLYDQFLAEDAQGR
jgi:hypothetical protein